MRRLKQPNLLFVGLLAGFASAALGIGGGVIVVPLLVLLFGYEMKKAVGTSLATIAPAALVGVVTHYVVNQYLNLYFGAVIIIGSIIGAKYGAFLANKLNARALVVSFAVLLVFVGLKLTELLKIPTGTISEGAVWFLIIVGLLAGSGSALFGIGGGVIMVPALNLFFGLTIHQAIATSLLVIVPTTISGAWFHRKYGNINVDAMKWLIPTSLVGAIIGAVSANMVPAATLRIVFGAFLLLVALKLFFSK